MDRLSCERATMAELKGAARRAAAFRRMREAHRTEMAEDYVELIGDLIAATGRRG